MSAEIQRLIKKLDIHVAVYGAPKTGKATLIRHLEKKENNHADIYYHKCEKLEEVNVRPQLIIAVCSPDFGYLRVPWELGNIPSVRIMLRADINVSVIENTPAISIHITERPQLGESDSVESDGVVPKWSLPKWSSYVVMNITDHYNKFINKYYSELNRVIAVERLKRLGNSLVALAHEAQIAGGDVVSAINIGLYNKSVDDLYTDFTLRYADK